MFWLPGRTWVTLICSAAQSDTSGTRAVQWAFALAEWRMELIDLCVGLWSVRRLSWWVVLILLLLDGCGDYSLLPAGGFFACKNWVVRLEEPFTLFWVSDAWVPAIAVKYFFLSSTGKLGLWGRTETLQQEDILRVYSRGSGQDQSSSG